GPMALITVIGSINTDQVIGLPTLPRAGETVLGGDLRTFGGGKGANQAMAAARLGGQVRMIGRIGADAFGTDRRRELLEAGIDVVGVKVDTAVPSGVALILVDDHGENMIALAPGANGRLTLNEVADAWEPGTRVALAVLEIPLAAVEEAFRRARADGAETVLNAAPPMELPDSLLGCVDHLIVNETEAQFLSGIDAGDRAGAFAAAARLRESVAKSVIVTLGGDGAVLYTATGRHFPAFEIEAMDTTAAGDAFCGAFGLARARGSDLLECMRYASAAGALTATRAGAQPSLPTASEVEDLLG
ncbi:MAG TPA: ribokinase, partial [Chloroflexota bacterium]|nr:ribokinase [Chloroflexota bacterium]